MFHFPLSHMLTTNHLISFKYVFFFSNQYMMFNQINLFESILTLFFNSLKCSIKLIFSFLPRADASTHHLILLSMIEWKNKIKFFMKSIKCFSLHCFPFPDASTRRRCATRPRTALTAWTRAWAATWTTAKAISAPCPACRRPTAPSAAATRARPSGKGLCLWSVQSIVQSVYEIFSYSKKVFKDKFVH